MSRYTKQQAIELLDRIAEQNRKQHDPEKAHSDAEDILLDYVPVEVLAAYERVSATCRWWAWA